MSRLYIKSVILKGFKSIEELNASLQPGLNIVIGKNGAGKSNFLIFLKDVVQSVFSPKIANFKSAEVVFATLDQQEFDYAIVRNSAKAINEEPTIAKYNRTLKSENKYLYNSGDQHSVKSTSDSLYLSKSRPILAIFKKFKIPFRHAKFIQFNTSADLKGLSRPLSLEISFDYDSFWISGHGDTLLLYNSIIDFESQLISGVTFDNSEDDGKLNEQWTEILNAVDTENFLKNTQLNQQVIDELKKFTPIEDVRLNQSVSVFRNDNALIIENIRLDFFVNGNWLPWSQLSDGTRRMFLLVSEISECNSDLILVEEPELGIHPHQFTLVMQFLKEQAEHKQVILSTHSPKALDILDIDELDSILIAEYQKGQGTVISKMSAEQKEKALSYVQEVGFLSDYWLMSDLEI